MIKEEMTVVNPSGLHTRPAKKLVAEAKKFESEITISFGEKDASLKSLIKVMKLGISQNARVEISCDGTDENEAMACIRDALGNLEDGHDE